MKSTLYLALVLGAMQFLPCKAQLAFQVRKSGSLDTTATVAPGGILTVDVVAQPPELTCPPNVSVPNDAGLCSAIVNYPDPVASGGVGSITIVCVPPSGSVFPVDTTTVNCTATDAEGQTATCSFTVTVNDTATPVITCPPDLTVQCLSDFFFLPPDFAGGSAIDNCDPIPVVTHLGDTAVGSNPIVFTRTYEAIDATGNSSTCTQSITVQGLAGDLNGDCCVDRSDLDILMARIRARSTDLIYDLNGNGKVDIADARWMALRFTNPGGAPCP